MSADLIRHLQTNIETILRPLIPRDQAVALLDFPGYVNPGDSAIWLGALRVLTRLGHKRPAYLCDQGTYCKEQLAGRLGSGTILLTGGGNLGDLWEKHQLFRERVIADFPERPIVQLPQSLHFQSRDNLQRARNVFNSHPRLTLLLRDRRSREFAQNEFRSESMLCPDLAFALGPLPRPCPPCREIFWLSRTDKEAPGQPGQSPPADLSRLDYLVTKRGILLATHDMLKIVLRPPARSLYWLEPVKQAIYALVAARTLKEGCRVLSSARVVVTNRLHGHILCILMGIPHYLSDNSYGKLSAFYRTWTCASDVAVWCESEADALRRASTHPR